MYFQTCKNNSSVFKRKADIFECVIKFETVFVSNNKDFFFTVSPKLFSSSEFDDTTLIISEKKCLIDCRSIFLFLEEFII